MVDPFVRSPIQLLHIYSACANVSVMSNNEHRTLTSEREIAAYLHRTRIAILDALRSGPATASQIGDKLGVHPANLTRHIRTLVDAD